MHRDKDVILIAGPTASGKSALAIELSRRFDGVVVNADSMQIYEPLRIITARPGKREEAQCEHRLFGYVSADQAYSVARWLEDARREIERLSRTGRKVILAGGTGLYFSAMLDGLSPMPEIDPKIRRKWRAVYESDGDRLHGELAKRDAEMAKKLKATDRQRIARALEVFDTTGKSIAEWQNKAAQTALLQQGTVKKFLLMPDRRALHHRINDRFRAMVEQGAIEEVERLVQMNLAPELPVMKAIGVPQLIAYLNNEISLEAAIHLAQTASRQYAKRQYTWFRNQFATDWQVLSTPEQIGGFA